MVEGNQMIDKAQLEIETDLSVGDWIRESLAPRVPFSENPVTIGIVIPTGFESYVLVHHTGPGDIHGGLGNETLETLSEILSTFTSTPEVCFHALWEGQGWMHPGGTAVLTKVKYPKLHRFLHPIGIRIGRRRTIRIRRPNRNQVHSLGHLQSHTLPEGIMDATRFDLPNRGYLLMRGPLAEAKNIGWIFSESFHTQSPNLLWPLDRQWILATEIDFNVTLIGGSEALISSILNQGSLTTHRFEVTNTIAELPVTEY